MAGDGNESLPRKLRRISNNESEEPSKRHKHSHHRRHRNRRKRNHDDKDAETNHAVDEKAQVPLTQPLVQPDDDVEEGEIREEDEEFIAEKQMDSSDAESGEIKVADADEELGEEVDERASSFKDQNVDVAVCHSIMRGVEVTVGFGADAALSSKRTTNGDTKMCDEFNLHKDSSVEHFCNRNISKKKYGRALHHGEDHCSNRSGSPDQAIERLQLQSIFEDASHLQVQQYDVLCNRDIRLSKDYGDETISRYENDYRHGSRDLGKEKEQGYDYSRHTAREDRYQSSDTWTRFRDKSQESWDRGREHGNRKRENNWDKVQGRTGEKDRNQERERERERERRKERDGEGRRERDQDTVKGKEYDKLTQNRKHYDADTGFANRDNHTDYKHRRPDEKDDWSKARRNDTKKFQSSKIDNLMKDAEKRDELERENYKESTMLQLAEKEEEEDEIDRIKKESRKRKQAILDKFKTRQKQQKLEAKLEIDVKPSLSAEETQSIQGEAADSSPVEKLFSVGKFPKQIGPPALKIAGSGALGEGTPKSEGSDDMFRDDIFGDSPAGLRKPDKGDCLIMERSGLKDNWDDAEGYYSYRFGEILDGRYEVIAAHGKGVFSSVVRAKDLKAQFGDPEEVAIKIIRSNDIMYKTGLEELVILKKLVAADQEDKRHCVRFISSFKYRNHLCLVFESLHMNLREVLKKFGRNIGLKLTAVRTYAKQLFIALKHLRNCGVLHCDIKPDNMLVNDAKNVLKLCDFGNAMFAGKNEVTPYLVSRFYRAPEIILGLRYDHPMDIWSVGCCLYEIYTGKVLFPGPSNNDMLRLHMELKGPFPKKMLRKGAFIDHHFDQDLNFLATEEDPVTKKTIKRLVLNIKPKDIGSIVLGSIGDDPKMLSSFKDLLEKIFALDPDKRITVSQSLGHPFITGK